MEIKAFKRTTNSRGTGLLLGLFLSLFVFRAAPAAPRCESVFTLHEPFYLSPKIKRGDLEALDPEKLTPLQSEVGMAEVDEKYKALVAEAERLAANQGRPVRETLYEIAQREASVGLGVLVDPKGAVHPNDGHHKILSLIKVIEAYHLQSKNIQIKVKLDKQDDFRDKSWEDFAARLEELHIGQLSDAQLAESQRLHESPGQRAQRFPKSFFELRDSPRRSATGRLFEILLLKGNQFKPNVQFEIAEAFQKEGVQFPPGQEFSPELQGRMLSLLFTGPSRKNLQKLFIRSALPERRRFVEDSLAQNEARYRRLFEAVEQGWIFDQEDSEDATDLNGAENINMSSNEAKTAFLMTNFVLNPSRALPEKVNFPQEKKFYKQVFRSAQKDSLNAKPEKIRDLLTTIAEGDVEKLSRADKALLKSFRKGTLKLRAAYRFLTNDNEAPARLDKFSYELGQLDDQLEKWDQGRVKKKLLSESAKATLKLLDKGDLFGDDKVEIISVRDFVRYNREKLDRMERALDDSQLTVGEYHWVRRRVREYANLFQILIKENDQAADDLVASLLSNLSHRMGQVKDGLLRDSDTAREEKNADARPTSIDPGSKELILRFLSVMRKSLDSLEAH